MVIAYDYTVLAGTQGQQNHKKQDRLFASPSDGACLVLFAEGGGGRPGDTDRLGVDRARWSDTSRNSPG